MGELFDTVLKNPFLLIIIIGGIISFLKGKSGKPEEEEGKQPSSNSKPVETSSQTPSPFGREQRTGRKQPIKRRVQETAQKVTVEEHRKEQMQRLSQQMSANQQRSMEERPKVADATREHQINNLASNYTQDKFKNQFKKSLTPKGLIDSIVMAEVLGAPRARQQYQSPVLKRRNTK